jgi:hypothetical protein
MPYDLKECSYGLYPSYSRDLTGRRDARFCSGSLSQLWNARMRMKSLLSSLLMLTFPHLSIQWCLNGSPRRMSVHYKVMVRRIIKTLSHVSLNHFSVDLPLITLWNALDAQSFRGLR